MCIDKPPSGFALEGVSTIMHPQAGDLLFLTACKRTTESTISSNQCRYRHAVCKLSVMHII